jgi:hypothetical protein
VCPGAQIVTDDQLWQPATPGRWREGKAGSGSLVRSMCRSVATTNDDLVLATALAGACDAIVTGDQDRLVLEVSPCAIEDTT